MEPEVARYHFSKFIDFLNLIKIPVFSKFFYLVYSLILGHLTSNSRFVTNLSLHKLTQLLRSELERRVFFYGHPVLL